jgi:hypothetical protein
MAAFNLCPVANRSSQFFGGNTAGSNPNFPLVSGYVNTFAAGTSTPIATFTSSTGAIQNQVSMQLDSTGRLTTDVWLQSGVAYKVQLTDSLANQIWIEDNITGIGDTGSSGAVTSEWISSGFVPTYSSGGNVFTTPGNSTGTFQVGRRVQAFGNNFGYLYGTVASATGAGPTTVTLTLDSGAMDSSLSAANVGLLGESNPSIPSSISYALTLGAIATTSYTASAQALSTMYNSATHTGTGNAVLTTYSAGINQGAISQNTTSGVITVTNGGTYLIGCVANCSTAGAATESHVYWGLNGSTQTRLCGTSQPTATSTQTASAGSTIRQLSANSQISLIGGGASPAPSQWAYEFYVVRLF